MCDKNCHTQGVAAFILGGLIGAALGVLFAPAKGESTRRKVKNWAEDVYEDGKEEFASRAHDIKEHFVHHAENLRDRFNDRAEEVRQNVSSRVDGLKEKAADLADKANHEIHKKLDK